MVSVNGLWRWAVASNDRAISNARAAATECSRRRVERAEVQQFLATYAVPDASTGGRKAEVVATGR